MVGGVAGLLVVAAALRLGSARAAQVPAAARRHVALRPRQPASPRIRVEPADRRARARPDGAAAAHGRARRPDAQLARQPAARCAEPVPRQRAARPGGRRARAARAGRRQRRRVPADGARAAGRDQRRQGSTPANTATRARAASPSASSTCRGREALPEGNRVSARHVLDAERAATAAGMSLEDGIAESLGVKLGDALTFDIAGNQVTAKVTSLRKVDWDSFRVNFFALFPPGPLDAMPTTYIAAFRAPDGDQRVAARAGAEASEHPGDRHRRDRAPGAGDHGTRVARGRVRVPVHAGGRACSCCRRPSRRRRTSAASTPPSCARWALRSASSPRRRLPSSCCSAHWRDWWPRSARRPSAGRSPTGCSRYRSKSNPLVLVYGVVGGACAVTLAGWLGTRSTSRQPPLAVIRQLG